MITVGGKRIYDSMKQKKQAEYLRNKEKYLERASKRYSSMKKQILEDKRKLYSELRHKLIEILGEYCCAKCGYRKNRLALTFEHKNGGGRKERERLGYMGFLQYYVNHPEDAKRELDVWCANCNLRDAKERKRAIRINSHTSLWRIAYRTKRQEVLFNVLLNQCQHCWESDREILVIDHKNGDGSKDLKLFGNQDAMMDYYYKHFDEARAKLQLLCANCNQIKMYKECYGITPESFQCE